MVFGEDRQASILSPVKEELDVAIWEGNHLKEEVKQFCFDRVKVLLTNFMEEEEIPVHLRRVILIGSITGYQYDDNADLDVNVLADLDTLSENLGVDKELLIYEVRRKVGETNGEIYPGTSHPCNIFLSTEEGYPPADGIYDMMTDEWIKKPGHPGNIDPYANLKDAIDRAEQIAEKVDAKWGAAQRTKNEIDKYPQSALKIQRQYIRYLKSLKRILDNVVNERRESFDMAREQELDPPQTGTPNVVYKFLENHGLLDILHEASKTLKGYEETGSFVTAGMRDNISGLIRMHRWNQIDTRAVINTFQKWMEEAEEKDQIYMEQFISKNSENQNFSFSPNPIEGVANKFLQIDGEGYYWDTNIGTHSWAIEELKQQGILNEEDRQEIYAGAVNLSNLPMEVANQELAAGDSETYRLASLSGIPSKGSTSFTEGHRGKDGTATSLVVSEALKTDSRASKVADFSEYIPGEFDWVQSDGEIHFVDELGEHSGTSFNYLISPEGEPFAWLDTPHPYEHHGNAIIAIQNEGRNFSDLDQEIQDDYMAAGADAMYVTGILGGWVLGTMIYQPSIYLTITSFNSLTEAQFEGFKEVVKDMNLDTELLLSTDKETVTTTISEFLSGGIKTATKQLPIWDDSDLEYKDLPDNFFWDLPRSGFFNKFVELDGEIFWWDGNSHKDGEVHHYMVTEALGVEDPRERSPESKLYLGYWNDSGYSEFGIKHGEVWCMEAGSGEIDPPEHILGQINSSKGTEEVGQLGLRERPKTSEYEENQNYPLAGPVVDGLFVRKDIPNIDSVAAELYEYEILPGVREVPVDVFSYDQYYSVDDKQRVRNLAEAIKESEEINPLIVVVDDHPDGPYILEGGHRSEALNLLGKKSFPALVVLDKENG